MTAFTFHGNGREFFKIWIVNTVLIIVTLGIYYPWAKVRTRRYFYGNTALDGRRFEYHATGKQLFKGYLIAMGLLIVYLVVQQVAPILSGLLLVLFFAALPWIIWRSLIFNFRLTSFSNVRFGFDGTLGTAYMNYVVYPVAFFFGYAVFALIVSLLANIHAVVAVAGMVAFFVYFLFAFSYLKMLNLSYLVNHARFGQGRFEAVLETDALMKILFKTTLLSIGLMIGVMVVVGFIGYTVIGLETFMQMQSVMEGGDRETIESTIKLLLPVLGLIYLGILFVGLMAMGYYMAKEREYLFGQMKLDSTISFLSTLKATPLIWVMVSNFLLIVMTLGLAYPWAKVRMAQLMVENTAVDTAEGFENFLTQQEQEGSALGDQIGDAFDVDVGIGF